MQHEIEQNISRETEVLLLSLDPKEPSEVDTFEAFQKKKVELAQQLNSALNETSLSLDFVSLLLSSVKVNLGKSTMSPHLTQNVPTGSLNADRLTKYDDPNDMQSKEANLGSGWKGESIDKITELFKNASLKLNEQISKEKTYWELLIEVLDHDEVLYKTRDPADNSRAIGIKYGYAASGSSYRDEGNAILRKDRNTGGISFVPISRGRAGTKICKYIKVRILTKIDEDYLLTGQSLFDKKFAKQDTSVVINDIEKARYFVFQEDLFYHLTREAKGLINYNILIISNKIIIEVDNELIEIESVVFDEDDEEELNNLYQNTNKLSSSNNERAEAILIFMNLMLCCFYKYNLSLKQKVPTAFTKWKQQNSHPLILRPLLGHIRHQLNSNALRAILKNHVGAFKQDLELEFETKGYLNMETEGANSDNPFQKSIEAPSTIFKLRCKSKDGRVLETVIDVTSTEIFVNLVLVLTVTRYNNSHDCQGHINGANVLQNTFYDLNEVDECLNWTIMNFIHQDSTITSADG